MVKRREWFTIRGINAEPWTSPGIGVGRGKGGGVYGYAMKDGGLATYQSAIAGALMQQYPDHEPLLGECEVGFYIWRQLVVYEGEKKKVTRNKADATNMQKALEDALEGVLIGNDRDDVHVSTWLMEQTKETEPLILIQVTPCLRRPFDVLSFADEAPVAPASNWSPAHDLF